MNRISKAESITLLQTFGLNTADRFVMKKPLIQDLLRAIYLMGDKYPKVSLRTHSIGKFNTPFFPNREVIDLVGEVDENWKDIEAQDEVILSEGINPDDSLCCGKIHDGNMGVLVEWIEGPGTVRDMEKLGYDSLNRETIHRSTEGWKGMLLRKVSKLFSAYPGCTIEWSLYKYGVGKQKSDFIFWEVIL